MTARIKHEVTITCKPLMYHSLQLTVDLTFHHNKCNTLEAKFSQLITSVLYSFIAEYPTCMSTTVDIGTKGVEPKTN